MAHPRVDPPGVLRLEDFGLGPGTESPECRHFLATFLQMANAPGNTGVLLAVRQHFRGLVPSPGAMRAVLVALASPTSAPPARGTEMAILHAWDRLAASFGQDLELLEARAAWAPSQLKRVALLCQDVDHRSRLLLDHAHSRLMHDLLSVVYLPAEGAACPPPLAGLLFDILHQQLAAMQDPLLRWVKALQPELDVLCHWQSVHTAGAGTWQGVRETVGHIRAAAAAAISAATAATNQALLVASLADSASASMAMCPQKAPAGGPPASPGPIPGLFNVSADPSAASPPVAMPPPLSGLTPEGALPPTAHMTPLLPPSIASPSHAATPLLGGSPGGAGLWPGPQQPPRHGTPPQPAMQSPLPHPPPLSPRVVDALGGLSLGPTSDPSAPGLPDLLAGEGSPAGRWAAPSGSSPLVDATLTATARQTILAARPRRTISDSSVGPLGADPRRRPSHPADSALPGAPDPAPRARDHNRPLSNACRPAEEHGPGRRAVPPGAVPPPYHHPRHFLPRQVARPRVSPPRAGPAADWADRVSRVPGAAFPDWVPPEQAIAPVFDLAPDTVRQILRLGFVADSLHTGPEVRFLDRAATMPNSAMVLQLAIRHALSQLLRQPLSRQDLLALLPVGDIPELRTTDDLPACLVGALAAAAPLSARDVMLLLLPVLQHGASAVALARQMALALALLGIQVDPEDFWGTLRLGCRPAMGRAFDQTSGRLWSTIFHADFTLNTADTVVGHTGVPCPFDFPIAAYQDNEADL
ncbi:hypothetical protein H696_05093 [Fonticula alba]|uniref:Uncharacterized protein n=1 Tax=Fonticula alba TaxID=691883 RepID=A0A058Z1M5_FONAL|nr:hypothetical protein H696_05093 [Fonticula alba]KCV68165.1 hypothetical protein H696_05093 [Fonticula alba]|eukprot:XP_009497219.1 hypothetical protein H696_05093 [Fonticula alba]